MSHTQTWPHDTQPCVLIRSYDIEGFMTDLYEKLSISLFTVIGQRHTDKILSYTWGQGIDVNVPQNFINKITLVMCVYKHNLYTYILTSVLLLFTTWQLYASILNV